MKPWLLLLLLFPAEALSQTQDTPGLPLAPDRQLKTTLTEGTWNMLALGIDPAHHRRGAARLLVSGLEADLAARSARLLIVDTSGTKAFDGARGFYEASGYEKESRIRDYWAEGDDKITFRKSLRKNA